MTQEIGKQEVESYARLITQRGDVGNVITMMKRKAERYLADYALEHGLTKIGRPHAEVIVRVTWDVVPTKRVPPEDALPTTRLDA